MTKKKKEHSEFPKGFFEKTRAIISNEEVLKDVVPLKWSQKVLKEKKKVLVKSTKE